MNKIFALAALGIMVVAATASYSADQENFPGTAKKDGKETSCLLYSKSIVAEGSGSNIATVKDADTGIDRTIEYTGWYPMACDMALKDTQYEDNTIAYEGPFRNVRWLKPGAPLQEFRLVLDLK
jgi:hypothetical protein